MKQTVTVTPKEAKKEESKYPYLGKCGSTIVLFTDRNNGMCIYTEHIHNSIGQVHGAWDEIQFTPIVGTITITQE